jgi:hypothetical protein
MNGTPELLSQLLRNSDTDTLFRTFAVLTHQMDAIRDLQARATLRSERDIVQAEITRRITPTITEVDLNVAAQRYYEASGIPLPAMTDKPKVVAGLRAALASLGVAVPDAPS